MTRKILMPGTILGTPAVEIKGRGGKPAPKVAQDDNGTHIPGTDMTEEALAEMLLGTPMVGALGGMVVRDALSKMVQEVNVLAKATEDHERFNALVAEAAKKGPKHKEQVLRLAGCRIVNAKILYWLPDHPGLLAPFFLWQELDAAPQFPRLRAFCAWWMENLDGKIHEVVTDTAKVFTVDEIRAAVAQYDLV